MRIYIPTTNDDRSFWIEPVVPVEPKASLRYWIPELNVDTTARMRIEDCWEPVSLRPRSSRGEPNIRKLSDVHAFSTFTGLSLLVSDRCRRVFEAEFPNEALYLPVSIEGASQSYWGLWVTEVIDALDTENSDITEIAPNLRRVSARSYLSERVGSRSMFRLPMVYGEPDQVTDRFRAITQLHDIKNIAFWDKSSATNRR